MSVLAASTIPLALLSIPNVVWPDRLLVELRDAPRKRICWPRTRNTANAMHGWANTV